MRRITLWLFSTVAALVLLFSYRTSTNSPTQVSATSISQPATTSPTATSSASPTTGGTGTSSAAKTYTGSVASTRCSPPSTPPTSRKVTPLILATTRITPGEQDTGRWNVLSPRGDRLPADGPAESGSDPGHRVSSPDDSC